MHFLKGQPDSAPAFLPHKEPGRKRRSGHELRGIDGQVATLTLMASFRSIVPGSKTAASVTARRRSATKRAPSMLVTGNHTFFKNDDLEVLRLTAILTGKKS